MSLRSAVVAALGLAAWAAPAPAQQYLVVIGGIGGEPRYEAAFSSHATRLVEAARTRYGIPDDRIVDTLGAEVRTLLENAEACTALSVALAKTARPDAADRVVDQILSVLSTPSPAV